ncbi:Cathepsin L-like protease [Giardia muris]|uniref:Cathepsin L-like protease n=1 Tax=Giardia muris TaxID=5742 RepID=A0A4Z1T865_GIAMU|nr:Cathepsin L-like protease [Giardia muris]|eukprot:TNJ30293.1 Cathepsin L-like protease [Giardia muris]
MLRAIVAGVLQLVTWGYDNLAKGMLLDNEKDMAESQGIYLLENRMEPPKDLPEMVDLRLWGLQTPVRDQGKCGACWAFAMVSVFETLMLLDTDLYSGSIFDMCFLDLHISEQFELNRSSSNKFCQAGSIVRLIHDHILAIVPTIETETHYPYTSYDLTQGFVNITCPLPKLSPDEYVTPFYIEAMAGGKAALIQLANRLEPYNETTETIIKAYLASGIPVLAQINTYAQGKKGHKKLRGYRYRTGLITQACSNATKDHQIVIVGYGTYQGQPAWLIRNSWGDSWGDHGFGFVSRGKNTLCIETAAHVLLPRSFQEYTPYQVPNKSLEALLNQTYHHRYRTYFDSESNAFSSFHRFTFTHHVPSRRAWS